MKVAVVGAGIGGLCLAQGLLKAGVDVTVYERDASLDSRGQGYRLHLDAGPALHACLPPDLYELCVATSGRPSTSMSVVTERLRTLRHNEINPPADPYDPATLSTSVNRRTFREILAARLGSVIEFGRTCTGFEQDAGSVRIHFADGSAAEADVLVAADGVGSPIRQQYLPHAQVEDTGSVSVFGRTLLTEQTRNLVPTHTWDGFTAVIGARIGMAIGVLDFREPPPDAAARIAPDVRLNPAQPYLMWGATGNARHFAVRSGESLGALGPAALHATVLATIRRWHPGLVRLVELAEIEETCVVTIRTATQIDLWPSSRVTLLGDAIHAMSPAGGSGANTALRDAALLATHLGAAARGEQPLVEAIAEYERQMVDYGFAAVRASRAAGLATTSLRGQLVRRLISRLPASR